MSALDATWWRMWKSGQNAIRRLLYEQPMRGASVAVVLLLVWFMLGGLFASVLFYLSQGQYESFKSQLVESLLSVFFFSLFFLVTISDIVLVWSTLFRSRSAAFHAQLPLSNRQLYWSASVEGGLWSSWAVLVLMCPLLGALILDALYPDGATLRSWSVAEVLTMLCGGGAAMAMFVLCCAAAGALGSQLLARLIPALRRGLKGIIALVVAGLMVVAVLILGSIEHRAEPVSFMSSVIGRLRFAENPYLPPWWAEQALSGAITGQWREWGYYMLLLASTAAFLALVGEWVAARRIRLDLDALTARPSHWHPLPLLPADLGLLVAKDLRLFLREPAQVLQFTMFFAILTFYLLLLPRVGKAFNYDALWRPIVSLLNLTAVAMALATFTGRFVYPMLSLEGKRLWVLVLAPWPRDRVVTAKFAFALLVGMPVSVSLVVLSGVMLELKAGVIIYQALTIACMVVGFSAGALGLGARLADYEEDNPAKLVAGYGGTINLMGSLLFTGLLMAGAAFPLIGLGGLHGYGLGAWSWIIGLSWTALVTTIWSVVFLRMAWRWFARSP